MAVCDEVKLSWPLQLLGAVLFQGSDSFPALGTEIDYNIQEVRGSCNDLRHPRDVGHI